MVNVPHIRSGVAQLAGHVTVNHDRSGFESLRRSRGDVAQLAVHHPVKVEGAGSIPVVIAMVA